jgi:hypothetical protein
MYLSTTASLQQIRLAEQTRCNRQETIKALSQGQVSQRDFAKWELITAGGALALKIGLNPFIGNAYGVIPTGVPRSDLLSAKPTPLSRCHFKERKDIGALSPAPHRTANINWTRVYGRHGVRVDGPMEGRSPRDIWAHQGWDRFPPKVAVEQWRKGAEAFNDYRPGVDPFNNCGIDPKQSIAPRFRRKTRRHCGRLVPPCPPSFDRVAMANPSFSGTRAVSGATPFPPMSTTVTTVPKETGLPVRSVSQASTTTTTGRLSMCAALIRYIDEQGRLAASQQQTRLPGAHLRSLNDHG